MATIMASIIPVDYVEYGIAVFALAGVFYIAIKAIEAYCSTANNDKGTGKDACDPVLKALDNNTKALTELGKVLNLLQLYQVEQGAMLKELVAHARKEL